MKIKQGDSYSYLCNVHAVEKSVVKFDSLVMYLPVPRSVSLFTTKGTSKLQVPHAKVLIGRINYPNSQITCATYSSPEHHMTCNVSRQMYLHQSLKVPPLPTKGISTLGDTSLTEEVIARK